MSQPGRRAWRAQPPWRQALCHGGKRSAAEASEGERRSVRAQPRRRAGEGIPLNLEGERSARTPKKLAIAQPSRRALSRRGEPRATTCYFHHPVPPATTLGHLRRTG